MAMRSSTQRSLLLAFIASISLCGLVGIFCLATGQMGRLEERILATTATVGACSILAMAAAISWERRRWHPIGPLGVIAVACALIFTLVVIWTEYRYPTSRVFERSMGTAWVLAVSLTHISLVSLARIKRQWRIAQLATVVVVAFLAGQMLISIWGDFYDDAWSRIMGVFGILVGCGTIAVPILHRVSAIKTREAVSTVELKLTIVCPRCSTQQELGVGRSKCRQCALRFQIEIEEDVCAKCGYPLYKLESANCPECGEPVVQPAA